MRWFIQCDRRLPVADCVQLYRPVVETLRHRLAELLVGRDKLDVLSLLDEAREWGIPETIALAWAELHEAFTLLDIARVQQVTAKPLEVVAPTYFAVHNRFRIEELLNRIDGLPSSTKWQAVARRPCGRTCPPLSRNSRSPSSQGVHGRPSPTRFPNGSNATTTDSWPLNACWSLLRRVVSKP